MDPNVQGRMRVRMVFGAVLGVSVGYLASAAVGFDAGTAMFYCGLVGSVVLMWLPIRIEDGHLVLDRDEYKLMWGSGRRAERVWATAEEVLDVVATNRNGFGIVLVLVGIGLIAALLPEAFRSVFQNENDLDVGSRGVLMVGAVLVAAGGSVRNFVCEA